MELLDGRSDHSLKHLVKNSLEKELNTKPYNHIL